MKFISFASLSIFALSLALPATAAPSDPVNAKKVVEYIHKHPKVLDPPCFWSGRTGNYAAYTEVKVFQGPPRNCHTLADIAKKAGVADPDKTFTEAEWGTMSKAFAEMVSGHVYVLLGQEVRKASAWLTIEKPILEESLKKKKVTGIEIWEIQKDGSTKKISGGHKARAEDEVELE
ncbi:hypothetical protein DXG01_001112 [Tephrocybe rancida]|nr:hypothetical protein DXG01_001112 [Tephrocybe rancida]